MSKNTLIKLVFIVAAALSALTARTAFGAAFSVRNLGASSGLSCNYVSSMALDKQGFIWIATEEGLNRFDGLGYVTFYKDAAGKGLTGNELNCLLDDATEPIMWIGTQRFGLNAYNYATGEFTYYRHAPNDPSSISTDDVTGLFHAADGNIWVSTYWKGVNLLDKKSGKFIHYDTGNVKGFPDNCVWCVADDGRGKLYVGHARHGFSVVDLKTRTAVSHRHDPADPRSIAGDDVRCIYRDRAGRVWVGTDKGLDLFNPDDGSFAHFTDNGRMSHRIFDIREMHDGRLWVAIELGGVAVINYYMLGTAGDGRLTAPVEYITKGHGDSHISGSSVRCMMADSYGNVWMGQYGEGVDLLTFRQPQFNKVDSKPYDTAAGLTVKTVLSVCLDRDGRIYAGTDGGGVNILDKNGRRTGVIPVGGDGSVQAALCDSRGRLWFGCFNDGAYIYSGGRPERVAAIGAHADVRAFYEDADGSMWIATSSGLYVTDGDGIRLRRHYDVPGNLVRSVARSTDGRIWVATFGNGLLVYSPGMKLQAAYNTANGFTSNTVNQVVRGSDGRMWACTAEGLVGFAADGGGKYTVYGHGNNLANLHIRSIAEDRYGNIWVSTNKGVSCMRKGGAKFVNWSYDDNIPIGNFLSQSVATDSDGKIYFGSNGGLCYFSPDSVLETKVSPPPVITRLMVYNPDNERDSIVSIIGRKEVSLSYMQNTFSIGFSPHNFSMDREVEFSYKMEGVEAEWTTTTLHDVTFHNLPPGKYRLKVRCRLRNQQWSKEVAEITVVVESPWWLSTWAKLAYTAIAVCLLYIVLRFYNHTIHLRYLYEADKKNHDNEIRLNNERMRFYTNITHELRTPLTLIIGPLKDLLENKSLPDGVLGSIKVVHASAMRLNDLVGKLLEFRKMETGNRRLLVGRGNIVAVIREMCSKYCELDKNGDVDIIFKSSQEIINVYFDREVIAVIVDNLVSNAVKYTESGRIVISVSLTDGGKGSGRFVEIAVADTGHGISADALPHIFDRYYQEHGPHQASGTGIGLSLVKSMVELHEGTVDVESKPGQGSTFRVRLDADKTYDRADHRKAYDAPAGGTHSEQSDTAEEYGGQKKIMLIVEDNRDICRYIADSFSDEFEIVTAENGREGLEAAYLHTPDIIISDIMMPYMSGTEMCKRLKADIRTSHVPIILLTAKDSMESKEEGYESGADSFITKPFVRSLIASRVANLLRQRKTLATAYQTASADDGRSIREKSSMLREAMSKVDREFLDRVDEHVRERMQNDKIDVDKLAESMNISTSTLYRKIKFLTGLSPNEYIRRLRMTFAEKLLLEGKFTIKEVGYRVGMSTTAYFRKCFKEEFGETPSEYLKRVKNDNGEKSPWGGGK